MLTVQMTRNLLALCFLLIFARAEDKPCTVHADGKYYDLSPLMASKDYEVKKRSGNHISLNVCQSVKTEVFGLHDGLEPADVAGVIRVSHGYVAVGKVNSSLAVYDSRPRLTYSEGSKCKAAGQATEQLRMSSMIEFVCDTSVSGSGTRRLIAALPPGDEESGCAFVVEWRTPHACPTSEGFTFWSFLATLGITFLALLLTYTIAGTLYNRYVLELRGYDQIPQFSLESMRYHAKEAFEWIRDMASIVAINLFSRTGGGSGGYSGLSSENPRTPNPVSHQAQVSGFATNLDVEHDAGIKTPSTFIRPQPTQSKGSFQRTHPQINPASHQAQVAQSLSFAATSPPPNRQVNPPMVQRLSEARQASQEERDFMLGEDDEDAEELGEITAVPQSQPTATVPSTSTPGTQTPSASSSTPSPPSNPAAAARGRDLGGGGTIQL